MLFPKKIWVIGVFVLSGCTSVPGFWPLSEPQSLPPGYPSALSSAATKPTCHEGIPTATSNVTPEQYLYCAQLDAVSTEQAFADEQRTLEKIKNGDVLALIGLGTAGGVQTVASSSTTPVRNIGLAAISLLGLSTGLGLDGQRNDYEAGATAVACLIRVDAALDDAKTVNPPHATLPAPGAAATLSLSDAGQVLGAAILNATRIAGGPGAAASPANALSTGASMMAIGALKDAQTAHVEDVKLRNAVESAVDTTHRAAALSNALNEIKGAVSDQLYKNVDLTKIYDAAKKGYSSLVGNVPSTQQSTQKAASNVSASGLSLAKQVANSSQPSTAAGPGGPSPSLAIETVQNAVQTATKDAGATQKVTDTYESCIGKATPQPQVQPKTPSKTNSK